MQGEMKQVADLALVAKIVQSGGISRDPVPEFGSTSFTSGNTFPSLFETMGLPTQ